MKRSHSGFTLLEILIALLIFAIMGVLAAASLQAMIRIHSTLKKTNHTVMQMLMSVTLIRRDLSEVIDRPIRNSEKGTEPAFTGSADTIQFTRTGLLNPFHVGRQSDMQRIEYRLNGNKLVRVTWDVLDPVKKTEPETQVILDNVQSVKWAFVAPKGDKSSVWPPPRKITPKSAAQPSSPPPLPAVVLMVMQIENEGEIKGVFPIPARGNYETPAQTTAPSP